MPAVKRVPWVRCGRGDWGCALWQDAREPSAGFAQVLGNTGSARWPHESGDGRSRLNTRCGPWRLGPLTGVWLDDQGVDEGFLQTVAEAGVAA